ncbi:MAG: hypothetical protein KBC21_03235 [Candidatus Pacebacteria bacterium]|nr:hypothetical protein [Candidatus Paceibacterota bacterium]
MKIKTLRSPIFVSGALFFIGTTFVNAQNVTTQVTGAFSSLKTMIDSFASDVLASFGTLLMGVAVVVFFIGIVQYVWGLRQGDSGKVKVGSNFMIWGLVALFVMFSVYGIVKFAQNIFFKDVDINTITVPQVKFNGGGTGGTSADPLNGTCVANQRCDGPGGASGICNEAGTRCDVF